MEGNIFVFENLVFVSLCVLVIVIEHIIQRLKNPVLKIMGLRKKRQNNSLEYKF